MVSLPAIAIPIVQNGLACITPTKGTAQQTKPNGRSAHKPTSHYNTNCSKMILTIYANYSENRRHAQIKLASSQYRNQMIYPECLTICCAHGSLPVSSHYNINYSKTVSIVRQLFPNTINTINASNI